MDRLIPIHTLPAEGPGGPWAVVTKDVQVVSRAAGLGHYCWRDREEQKPQLSKGSSTNCKSHHPKTKCLPPDLYEAGCTFHAQSPVCIWSPELWSKMGLGTDNLDRARQKEEQPRWGKLRILLGRVRETFVERGPLELGFCRTSKSS